MAVQISGNDITVPRDGTFTRNVTIGGTLTYEDVTNIDSVGLITARTGIEIGARPGVAASISIDGNMIVSGITTFGGDVQVPDKIIHSGDTNTAIRFPAADTITAETSGAEALRVTSTTAVIVAGTSAYSDGTFGEAKLQFNTKTGNHIGACSVADTNNSITHVLFKNPTGAIASVGTHNSDFIALTGNAERLRIDSSGRLLLGTNTARAVGGESNPRLHIEGTGATSNSWVNITRFAANNGSPNIQFAKSRSNTAGDYTIVQNGDNLGQISFLGADGTDMANYAALIKSQVDGTPGSNDMPGKLVFATTADGAGFPTPAMEINSAGIVTCRSIPSFKCAIASDASPNSGVVSEDNGYTLHSAVGGYRDSFNTGSHFNEADGKFTAPVEGLYFFGFSVMRSSTNGSGSIDLRIKKNASLMMARTYRVAYTGSFESHNVQTITRMGAGHYITFNLGANMSVYEDDSYMFGYLIG